MRQAIQNCVSEWSYSSAKTYADPFNEMDVDVLFTDPDGEVRTVPAFWAGEQTWTVRYASAKVGVHHYRAVCSDTGNPDIHGQEGTLEVRPYDGSNPLLRHGALRVAPDRRHLQHQDGAPFFWLGDTWWMGLCKRLAWPQGFQELTMDRVRKGFTVVLMVAGLYPDMAPFDERGANEAGFPWERDFTRINPAYFDMADLRIAHLVQRGLVPSITGSWGFFMSCAGLDVLKRHWRNLIARYAAYPVVWCVCGEALMPFYVANRGQQAELSQDDLRVRWSELTRYIRTTDSFHNPITIHPVRYGHKEVDDPSVLDIDMLHTGHGGYPTVANTVNMVEESLPHEPKLPVLVCEVNYEGIQGSSHADVQRMLFWACMLSGTAGHTYAANGIWQVNTRDKPYGASPHGMSWGNLPWDEAYRLPGSAQIGLGKQLMERYRWWEFAPHREWIEPYNTVQDRRLAYIAGIPDEVRMAYFPAEMLRMLREGKVTMKNLRPDGAYHAFYFDPVDGTQYELGTVAADAGGNWSVPRPPIFQDWVLVLECATP